jgi:hypothetical protein
VRKKGAHGTGRGRSELGRKIGQVRAATHRESNGPNGQLCRVGKVYSRCCSSTWLQAWVWLGVLMVRQADTAGGGCLFFFLLFLVQGRVCETRWNMMLRIKMCWLWRLGIGIALACLLGVYIQCVICEYSTVMRVRGFSS